MEDELWAGPGSGTAATTAAEEAYRYVLHEIRRGTYRPGRHIRAEEVATAIDMSRMPVREALQRLVDDGLLRTRPNRGVVVEVLSRTDVEEIFEIRSVLEGLAVRLATPKLDERACARLRTLLDAMDEAAAERDSVGWMSRHRQFHEYLCSLSERPRLVAQIARLHTMVEPYLRMWLEHYEGPLWVRREHEAVIDAAYGADPDRAEAVMKEHIRTTSPDLAPYLE